MICKIHYCCFLPQIYSTSTLKHRKLKKKKTTTTHYFLKPGFEDLGFRREIHREVAVGRGPSPPPLGRSWGFQLADTLGPRVQHCCSLTLAGEKPAGGRGCECGLPAPVLRPTPTSLDHACNWASSVPSLAWQRCSGHQSPRHLWLPGSWGARKGSAGWVSVTLSGAGERAAPRVQAGRLE